MLGWDGGGGSAPENGQLGHLPNSLRHSSAGIAFTSLMLGLLGTCR